MRKGDLNRDQYLILARPAVQNWTEFKTNFDLNGDGATQITADPSSKSTLNSDQVWTSLVQRDLNHITEYSVKTLHCKQYVSAEFYS